ncbi:MULTISPECIES: beta-lactamase hydrolase domain-containing protein [unclassified Moraxella]|uniref:beta-lactamase hydrolase domain-containing protein n=1 Tax=unclassified Moraxella TaxID=2685852 RepID=UPI003AF64B49
MTIQPLNIDQLQTTFTEQNLGQVLSPEPNIVVTGAIAPSVIDALKQAGINVVINVQPASELTFDEQSAIEQAGMSYVNIPVSGADDLTEATINQFDQAMTQYASQNMLLHCKSGNRVGAIVALQAGLLQGYSAVDAVQRGKDFGLLALEPVVAQRLG